MEENEKTFTGVIVWFNTKKGFGFSSRDDGGKDIFIHYSDINMEGYKNLMAGDIISFEEGYTFKNLLKATNIILIEKARKNDIK